MSAFIGNYVTALKNIEGVNIVDFYLDLRYHIIIMIDKVISEILATEEEARAIVDSASARAKELIEQNERIVAELFAQAAAQIKSQTAAIIGAAQERADAAAKAKGAQTDKLCREIADNAKVYVADAVADVLKAVRGA